MQYRKFYCHSLISDAYNVLQLNWLVGFDFVLSKEVGEQLQCSTTINAIEVLNSIIASFSATFISKARGHTWHKIDN